MKSLTTLDRRIAAAAAVVGIAALIGALFFWANSGSDEGSGSASAAASSAPGTDSGGGASDDGLAVVDPGDADPEKCRVKIRSATLRPDPETGRTWQELGLQMRPISPGVGTPTGVEFLVTSSTGLTCDLHNGVIGTRGGMGFSLNGNKLDLRRTRLDFSKGLMTMFPSSVGFEGINASGLTLGDTSVVQNGSEVTVIVPLRATPDVAGQMNLALGEEVFSSNGTVGTFHLVGERNIISS